MEFHIVRLTQDALWLVLILSAPVIIAVSLAGLLVSFIQAVTQMQEQTVQFAVKLVVVVVTLFLTASLIGGTLVQFGERIFTEFPQMIGTL